MTAEESEKKSVLYVQFSKICCIFVAYFPACGIQNITGKEDIGRLLGI
jgi:hypothetical protein